MSAADPARRRSLAQRLVARGYRPPPEPAVPVGTVYLDGEGLPSAGPPPLPPAPAGGIAVLLPTVLSRCGPDDHLAHVRHVLDQLADVHTGRPDLPLSLWIGMQWGPGERGAAADRLAGLVTAASRSWLHVVGLHLPGPGKTRTTNAAIRLARPLRPAGWLWIDDDVLLDAGCLRTLVERFLARGCDGAVGARKIVLSTDHRVSRLLSWVSRQTVPYRSYPHGCCMLVAADVVERGIPDRLGCDDGFVLFELLDPGHPNPFHRLQVLPEAGCRFHRGAGAAGDSVRRFRCAVFSQVLHMADASRDAARVYFRESLGYGLWPFAPWDSSRGVRAGAVRWLVKAVHTTWLGAVGLRLAARGLAGRPLQTAPWVTSTFSSPASSSPASAERPMPENLMAQPRPDESGTSLSL